MICSPQLEYPDPVPMWIAEPACGFRLTIFGCATDLRVAALSAKPSVEARYDEVTSDNDPLRSAWRINHATTLMDCGEKAQVESMNMARRPGT
jgi:hypothetical protein